MGQLTGVGFDPFITMISVLIDGGGAEIADNVAVPFGPLPEGGYIKDAYLRADQSGSVSIDLWVSQTWIPTNADSITASAPLAITDSDEARITLTGWDIALERGDNLIFSVDSCTTITWVLVTLWIQRQVNDNG